MGNAPTFDIHPDMNELLAAKAAVNPETGAGPTRTQWDSYDAALRRPYPTDMRVEDMRLPCTIKGGPGAGTRHDAPARLYRPGQAAAAGSPLVVYIHGGGFIKGSLESGDPIAAGIAERTGFPVISIDYRLAPEHPFPWGVEDCYAAIAHIVENASRFGADPTRIGLWGDSAGGNMAAASCLLARDRGNPAIAAQVIVYPCLTDELTSPSYETYRHASVTTAAMERSWSLYLGDRRPTRDPYAAPVKAKDLSNLPPAFIHVAEVDCLADDGIIYARRLKEAGSPAILRIAKRMIHGFTRARHSGPAAAAEFDAPCTFLKDVLAAGQPGAAKRRALP
ncbi:MAG: alpha/beta hydrolase [Alphaproteobacteria bacterium]